jgi:phage-related protein
MATFPSITPTYGQQKRSAPNTRTVRFADGYEHRILFGLAAHQNPKIFNLTFNVSETDADTIEGFLDSRANDSASFTFTPPGEGFTKTGTYSQSGTTVTITITSHGVAVGDELTIDYTSGSATDGTFLVASVTDSNVFTVTAATSATNSGNVSITLSGAGQYVCENWNKSIPYNNRATIQATFREVFEP